MIDMKVTTILLVEDDELFAKMFTKKLQGIGDFTIYHCNSAESGLEFIKKTKPQLLFLDHELGGMNGVDAIHLFQSAVKDLEICMVSSQKDPAVLGDALDQGVKYFRKNALLEERTKEFMHEIQNKPSRLSAFWQDFIHYYTKAIPEHL